MAETMPSGQVTPSNVYAEAFVLQDALTQIAERYPNTMPSDGFLILPQAVGRITPTEVIEVLQTLLAEVTAMRQTAGIPARAVEIPQQIGKVPADVLARLKIVITLAGLT